MVSRRRKPFSEVLTITNELLYDGLARQTFASRPRFLAPELDVEASEMAMELGKANARPEFEGRVRSFSQSLNGFRS